MLQRGAMVGVVGLIATIGSGCMNGPLNGTLYDGDGGTTAQQQVGFYGFYPQPNQVISVQVLKSPTLDPTVDSNWAQMTTTTTGTVQYFYNDPSSPMYLWQANATPGTVALSGGTIHPWTSGGLSRVRAQAITPNGSTFTVDARLTAFDEDFNDCKQQLASQSWSTVRNDCKTLYSPNSDVATLVSSTARPSTAQAAQPTSPYLSLPGNPGTVGTAYYHANSIDALYPTLGIFKMVFGFGLNNPAEGAAVYYNAADLGLGREMHCTVVGTVKACYVTNYADRVPPGNDSTKRIFGGSPTNVADALANAVKGIQNLPGSDPVATVAMVETPVPSGGSNVLFMVYGPDGTLSPTAILDGSAHPNTQVPTNCMSCHAGNGYVNSSGQVVNAHFLPFDLDLFQYSSSPNYTESAQLEQFRRLNAVVAQTSHPAAFTQLLAGWYPPNGPQTSTPDFNGDFVPDNWSYRPANLVYNYGVKKFCRTCHLGQTITDFSTPTQLTSLESSGKVVSKYLCDTHLMPQALVTQNNFWNSSARAHFLGFLGANRDCAP